MARRARAIYVDRTPERAEWVCVEGRRSDWKWVTYTVPDSHRADCVAGAVGAGCTIMFMVVLFTTLAWTLRPSGLMYYPLAPETEGVLEYL